MACRRNPERVCGYEDCSNVVKHRNKTRADGVAYCCRSHAKLGKIPPNMEANHAAHAVEGDPEKVCEICSEPFFVRGKRKSWGRYCSYECKGKANSLLRSKENHWNWKGGVTPENQKARSSKEYNNWRFAVYKRDHFTCRVCEEKCSKKTVVAHHILEWSTHPDLRYVVDNGVVMCRSCHLSHHQRPRRVGSGCEDL